MYVLEKNNTSPLCVLGTLMPQNNTPLTLTLVRTWYEKSAPMHSPNLPCLLVHTSTSYYCSFQHNSIIHGTSTPSQPILSTITTQKSNKLHGHYGLSLKAPNSLHPTFKANVPNLVTCLNKTPLFEWYMVRCGSKNGYQKDTCLKETGLHVQSMIIIPGFIVNMTVDTYMTMSWARESSL